MIRTLAAIAALAALPGLATAQSPQHDPSGVTVRGHSNSYSIAINTRGKAPAAVRREIWKASYVVCERAPFSGNVKDLTVEAMQTCVTQAQGDGVAQYHHILHR